MIFTVSTCIKRPICFNFLKEKNITNNNNTRELMDFMLLNLLKLIWITIVTPDLYILSVLSISSTIKYVTNISKVFITILVYQPFSFPVWFELKLHDCTNNSLSVLSFGSQCPEIQKERRWTGKPTQKSHGSSCLKLSAMVFCTVVQIIAYENRDTSGRTSRRKCECWRDLP